MKLFSKLLTRTDVEKRLAIPTSCLKHFNFYGGSSVSFRVADETGTIWSFCCSTRKGNYPKPCFSKGWCQFTRSRSLCEGDRVEFYKDFKPEAEVYRIRVQRKIMLFGKECWSNPPAADHGGVNSETRTEAEAEVNEVQTRQNTMLRRPADEEEVNFDKTTADEAEENERNSSS